VRKISIGGVLAEIRTQHFPNTNVARYRYTRQLDGLICFYLISFALMSLRDYNSEFVS
jgi:hypothetical protein